jgi:Mycobacterial 4 TMS phage holin, superfamily IV
MKLLLRWLLLAAALLFVAYVYDGVSVQSFQSALLAAFVIGLLNTFIKPFCYQCVDVLGRSFSVGRFQRHWLYCSVGGIADLLRIELFDQHGCG